MPKWYQDDPRMIQRWSQDDPKMIPRWYQDDTKMIPWCSGMMDSIYELSWVLLEAWTLLMNFHVFVKMIDSAHDFSCFCRTDVFCLGIIMSFAWWHILTWGTGRQIPGEPFGQTSRSHALLEKVRTPLSNPFAFLSVLPSVRLSVRSPFRPSFRVSGLYFICRAPSLETEISWAGFSPKRNKLIHLLFLPHLPLLLICFSPFHFF